MNIMKKQMLIVVGVLCLAPYLFADSSTCDDTVQVSCHPEWSDAPGTDCGNGNHVIFSTSQGRDIDSCDPDAYAPFDCEKEDTVTCKWTSTQTHCDGTYSAQRHSKDVDEYTCQMD